MKIRQWICLPALVTVLVVTAATTEAATNKVFRLTLSAPGTLGALDYGPSQTLKVKLADWHLMNLAGGYHPSDPPAPMDALALVYQNDLSDAKIMVMDYIQMVPQVTVATVVQSSRIRTSKGDQVMLVFQVIPGAATPYYLQAGTLVISGTVTFGSNGEPSTAKLTLSGFVRFLMADDAGIHAVEFQTTKGKVSITEKLGEYVDP